MPRFFTKEINASKAIILGEDAKHITKVLRMKVGDSLIICDAQGTDYQCEISALSEREILLTVLEAVACKSEPNISVKLYQANPKGDKFELIIQKAVELGVSEIIPVQTHRCVSRPDERSMAKKLERYNRISYEAAKQCGRGKIPIVRPMLSFREAVEEIAFDSMGILFYEQAKESFKKVLSNKIASLSILIGAEGGFEESEVRLAEEKGLEIITLGHRILRCETAPLAALAVIMFETGNLG